MTETETTFHTTRAFPSRDGSAVIELITDRTSNLHIVKGWRADGTPEPLVRRVFSNLDEARAFANALWAALFAAPGSIALGFVWPRFSWRWGLVLSLAAGVALALRVAVDPGAIAQWGQSQVLFAAFGFLASACLWSVVGSVIGRLRPSNRTPHADAGDAPAHANGIGARAGGRGR